MSLLSKRTHLRLLSWFVLTGLGGSLTAHAQVPTDPQSIPSGLQRQNLADTAQRLRDQESALVGIKLPLTELEDQLECQLKGNDPARWARAPLHTPPVHIVPPKYLLSLVHLWQTTCAPCRAEMAELLIFLGNLGKDKALSENVQLMLIAEPDSREAVIEFSKTFPGLQGVRRLCREQTPAFLDRLGTEQVLGQPSLPATLLLDRCGIVRQVWVGSLRNRFNFIEHNIRRLVKNLGDYRCAGEDPSSPKGSQARNEKGKRKLQFADARPARTEPAAKRAHRAADSNHLARQVPAVSAK